VSPKTLRNLLTALVILVLGAASAGILVKIGNKPERKTPPAARPVVSAFTVSSETDPIRVRSYGSVKAKRSVSVVTRVNGEVMEKSSHFEAGGYFSKGETLLKIEDTDYILAVEQARANVAQSEYNLARAEEEAQVAQREWERIGNEGFDSAEGSEPTAPTWRLPRPPGPRPNSTWNAVISVLRSTAGSLTPESTPVSSSGRAPPWAPSMPPTLPR